MKEKATMEMNHKLAMSKIEMEMKMTQERVKQQEDQNKILQDRNLEL